MTIVSNDKQLIGCHGLQTDRLGFGTQQKILHVALCDLYVFERFFVILGCTMYISYLDENLRCA